MGRSRRAPLTRLAIALGMALAVLGLAGCVRIVGVTASQHPLDDVAVTVVVCAVDDAGCPRGALALRASTGIGQALLGFRIPAASEPPASFSSSDPAGVVAFSQDPGFTAELERLAPAGPGRRWVGYLSNPLSYTANGGPQRFTATARFTLLQGPDGAPFPRPFHYRVVAGSRISQGNLSPARPVVCGSALDAASADNSTVCANSPPAGEIGADLAVQTRDAGVLAGAAQSSAAPGALAALPFTIAYSGAGGVAAPRLSLSASTTLPGATVTATPNVVIPPADGSVRALVTVEVPGGAPPGRYEVRLTATAPPAFTFFPIILLQAGQGSLSRVGVGSITVLSPDQVADAGEVTISRATAVTRFRRSRSRGFIQVRGTSTRAARLNVLVRRRGRVGSLGRSPAVRNALFRSRRVRAGRFRMRIRVASGFVPGRYRVTVAPVTGAGIALPQRTASVRLRAPRAGVVDSAFASIRKGGRSIRRVTTRPRALFANFRFAPGALPARGRRWRPSIRWFRNGRAIGRLEHRSRRRSMSAFVRRRSRAPLPPGRYRAVLRSGRTVVAVADVRVG